MTDLTLREITRDTFRDIVKLEVGPDQQQFVASNAVSIAEASFYPQAWFRAIYADEQPVGFVMLYEDPEKGEYYLWRFMIAAGQQGKGYGRRALELVVEHVRDRPNARELRASYVPGDGCPAPFYAKYGWVETGEVEDGENVIRYAL